MSLMLFLPLLASTEELTCNSEHAYNQTLVAELPNNFYAGKIFLEASLGFLVFGHQCRLGGS
jgi:hypothetical protein